MTKQAPKKQTKPKKNNPKLKQRFFTFSIKLGITALCMGSFYAIYLDGKIRSKMDGQIWQLPAEVYSQIPVIQQPEHPTLLEVKQLLIDNGYRQNLAACRSG